MAGKFGVLRMDVNCLNETGEGHQQHAEQG